MAKFAVYTVVHEGFTAHSFKPGDDVPEWAIDLVGDHVLEPETQDAPDVPDFTGAPETPADDAGTDDADSDDADSEDSTADTSGDALDAADEAPEASDVPDFTAPAPTPARRGRPRKQ
jgi:hypothetical protein